MAAELKLATVPHLSQLAENNSLKFLLVHFGDNGSQVLFHNRRVEAVVELVYVVVVKGERLIVDDHLGDQSGSALVAWNIRNSLR